MNNHSQQPLENNSNVITKSCEVKKEELGSKHRTGVIRSSGVEDHLPIRDISSADTHLGCGKRFNRGPLKGTICGVPNGWGKEILCKECDAKLRLRWKEEEQKNINTKGGNK